MEPPNQRPNSGDWRIKPGWGILVFAAIAFYQLLIQLPAVLSLAGNIMQICTPFLVGAMLAFLLDGLVRPLEKRLHGNRTAAVFLALSLSVLALIALFALLIPQLLDSLSTLVAQAPVYQQSIQSLLRRFGLDALLSDSSAWEGIQNFVGRLTELELDAEQLLPQMMNGISQLGSGLLHAAESLLIMVFVLLSKSTLLRQMKKLNNALLPPRAAAWVCDFCRRLRDSFVSFFNGKMLDSLLIGLICLVALTVLDIPYAPLISLVTGITNIIPFFGPFIGAIPNTILLLMADPVKALVYLVFILILQQFDGNFLGPKILGKSLGIPPIWMLVTIVLAGSLFGFAGLLFGVPVFAVLYDLFRDWINHRLQQPLQESGGAPSCQKEEDPPQHFSKT